VEEFDIAQAASDRILVVFRILLWIAWILPWTIQDYLPSGDSGAVLSRLYSPGGSTILGGGLRYLIASSFHFLLVTFTIYRPSLFRDDVVHLPSLIQCCNGESALAEHNGGAHRVEVDTPNLRRPRWVSGRCASSAMLRNVFSR